VATLLLPDGQPIAVSAGWDATVRVWNLATGTPLGDPLVGHTGPVDGVATLLLPDKTPIAITASRDATVRVWDLTTGRQWGHELSVTSPVAAMSAWRAGDEIGVVIAGLGMFARVDIEELAL
jgi:WD40 repeat protein